MKTLAKLSDKRDQIVYHLIRKRYVNIYSIQFPLTAILKEGSRLWGGGGSDILLVEKPFKKAIQHFNHYTRSPEKMYLTFAFSFLSLLHDGFSCADRNRFLALQLPACSFKGWHDQFFKSSFSLSKVPICLAEDYRLNSTESNWIILPLHIWSIPLSVDLDFLLKFCFSNATSRLRCVLESKSKIIAGLVVNGNREKFKCYSLVFQLKFLNKSQARPHPSPVIMIQFLSVQPNLWEGFCI